MTRARPDVLAFALAAVVVLVAGVIICAALASGNGPADAVRAVPDQLWIVAAVAAGGGAGIAPAGTGNPPSPPAAPERPTAAPPTA